ncbi:MAG: ABC transporter permease [Planctomycetaceae bacterium]
MFAGPLLTRDVLTTPRQWQHFLMRSGYVAAFAILLYTAGQTTFGFQQIRNIGDVAQFGSYVFGLFAAVQLSLVIAGALLFSANTVAQEKDKRTLILLLMTDLRSHELVVGKLLGSLLPVFTLILVSLPIFCFLRLLGGVSMSQVLWLEAICLVSVLAAGAWGTLVAYWRDKTFQTLAVTVIGALLFIAIIEFLVAIIGGDGGVASLLALLNPYRALGDLLNPLAHQPDVAAPTISAAKPVLAIGLLAAGLITYTIARVRVWNPSRSVFEQVRAAAKAEGETRSRHRAVWSNPVVWREIITRAYGRKMLVIKGAYLLIAALLALWVVTEPASSPLVLGMLARSGAAFAVLIVVGMLLLAAQAVTALTTERDSQTLELLLVTDITAKEFIFGKLAGIFYNSKEVLLVPLAFLVWFAARGELSVENFLYLFIGLVVLACFCAMLGLHGALSYTNSRKAILHSLGTVFFLFVGTFVCIVLLVEARGDYSLQLPAFVVFAVGGTIGLMASLAARNPSPALLLTSTMLPFATIYSILGFLMGNTLGVAAVIIAAYGFASIAMLIPAVSEFDYALGRTTLERG